MSETADTMRIAVEADTSGFDRALGDLTTRANSFGSALAAAFRGGVGGGKSFDGVLRQLGQRLSTIALDAALKPLTNLAGGLFGRLLGGIGAAGGAGAGGGGGGGSAPAILPFAKGGVVRSPSFFPAGGRMGLMGEAGAEAILPLRRGADGSLGVALQGGAGRSGPSIVFNVSTPDAPSFRRAEVQIQAMLARAAQRGQRGL